MTFELTRAALARVRDSRGFTLVEMLIVMLLLSIVVGALLAILDDTTSVANRDQERSTAVQEANSSLRRMVNELSEAVRIVSADPNSIDFVIRSQGPGKPRKRIAYDCGATYTGRTALASDAATYRQCNRSENVLDTETVCCDAPAGSVMVVDLLRNGAETGYHPSCTGGQASAMVPVFTYSQRDIATGALEIVCNNAGTALTAPQQTTSVAHIVITFRTPRRGERTQATGFRGDPNIFLQDGVFLKNMRGRYAG